MQHELQAQRPWRQLAIGVFAATAVLILIRVATETDWSRETVGTIVRSSAITGLIGFPVLFGLQLSLARFAKTQTQMLLIFLVVILAGVAAIATLVPALNWLMGNMIAPNAPGDSREDFASYLSQYFLAVYWRFAVIMGPLFLAFNWRWFTDPLAKVATGHAEQAEHDAGPTPAVARSQENMPGEALASETAANEPETAEEWLVNKLAMPKRGRLWAISSELHYLRVYTDVADDLVLMRLSDALERLQDTDGIQIHRSHWVARAGVRDLIKGSGNLEVELHNGARLPVSRPNAAAVRRFFKA